MDAPAASMRAITSDAAAVALRCGESCVGVLFVCTGGRALGKDEITQFGALADDISGCVSRLREDSRRRADIAHHKQAQEAVNAERNLLRTIIDAVPHYIYVKDDQGRFTITNAAWLSGRGLTRERVHGKTVYELFPQSAAAHMDAQDRQVIASGMPVIETEQQIASPTPDGSTELRWTSTTKVPLRDTAGHIIGVVGVSRDITQSRQIQAEHARAEETIARERALLRAIIDALPDFIYVKDRDGRFHLGNKAWLAARGRALQMYSERPRSSSFLRRSHSGCRKWIRRSCRPARR